MKEGTENEVFDQVGEAVNGDGVHPDDDQREGPFFAVLQIDDVIKGGEQEEGPPGAEAGSEGVHVLELLLDHNQDALAEGFRLLVNEAMKAERNCALNAAPYERTEKRLGYANGFKPKTVATRLGSLTFQVPQVHGDIDFYPSARGA